MRDTYKTIKATSRAEFVEQRSRFIAYAVPVTDSGEALEIVDKYRKKYNDARHVCWAYRIGENYNQYRAYDDGEPSGTAGRPILGQINSNELTNVLVVVIRYFGGIKLGTGGLVSAYQQGAKDAINSAIIIERMIGDKITFSFNYPSTNEVNQVINDFNAEKIYENYTENCVLSIEIRKNDYEQLRSRLELIEGLQFIT